MCFIDKRKMNWIRKEDHVLDPVRPPGQVGYGDAGRHNFPFSVKHHPTPISSKMVCVWFMIIYYAISPLKAHFN